MIMTGRIENNLNFGCGLNILDGYENYDKYPVDDRVQFLDLNLLPLPFKNNFADIIRLEHTLEHLDCNILELTKELVRILKKDGTLFIKCPCEDNSVEHTKAAFTPGYFDWLLKNDKAFANPEYSNVSVSEVSIFLKRRGFFGHIKRLVHKIRMLDVKEIQWVIVK